MRQLLFWNGNEPGLMNVTLGLLSEGWLMVLCIEAFATKEALCSLGVCLCACTSCAHHSQCCHGFWSPLTLLRAGLRTSTPPCFGHIAASCNNRPHHSWGCRYLSWQKHTCSGQTCVMIYVPFHIVHPSNWALCRSWDYKAVLVLQIIGHALEPNDSSV